MSDIVIKNACIVTCDNDKVIPDGYLVIKDGLVKEIGDSSHHRTIAPSHHRTINAGGRIVMPGFVNAHTHLYSQFARGLSVPRMRSFLEILNGLWWRLDRSLTEEDIYMGAVLGLIQAIKAGVTTVIDHHASYGCIKGSLAAIERAFKETGMRGVLCYEVSDRDGEKKCGRAIEENTAFLARVADKCSSPDYLLRGMMGLHASFTISAATIKKVHEANSKYKAPYHIHVAEGAEDAEDAKARYNASVVQRLYDEGILQTGTIAAHCIHVSDKDIETIKKSGAAVVHNPVSNMNNAVGCAPYLKLAAAGIPVGIGTDGMSMGIEGDIKAASVMHKEAADDPQAGWNEVCDSTLKVNPQIASNIFGQKFGVLKPDAAADVIIADYMPFTEVTSANYWGHILFGVINSRIHTTIVNGRILMEGYNLTGLDEVSIIKKASKLSSDLWKRFNKAKDLDFPVLSAGVRGPSEVPPNLNKCG